MECIGGAILFLSLILFSTVTKSSHVVKYDQSALQGSWNVSSAEKTLHITHTHILRGHIILNPPPVSVCSIWSSSQGGYFPREREAVK